MSTRRTISNTFTVNVVNDGQRGKTGRFYYYGGIWNTSDTSQTFTANDAQAPFFKVNTSGSAYSYFVYNGEDNFTNLTMQQISQTYGAPSSSSANWAIMTDDFKFLISEAIFAAFAKFGAAIITGDWMISAYGKIWDSTETTPSWHVIDDTNTHTISGHTYTVDDAYTLFNPSYPNSEAASGNNFVPNYAVNLLTGETYQHNGYFSGTIFAQNGVFSGFIRKKKVIITNSNYNEYARQIGQSTRLDFDKCGTFIEFQMNEFPRELDLPILCWYYSPSREGSGVTQERADDVRSYVGTKCIIYNGSGTTYNIDLKRNHNGTLQDTYALYDGCCVSIECVLGYDEVTSQGTTTRYENIYWIASDYSGIHIV